MQIKIRDAFRKWTYGRILFDASQYTGRGPDDAQISSETLEWIYQGIRQDVGQAQASSFAWLVAGLEDLSASAFIQAFQTFWDSNCHPVIIRQEIGSAYQLSRGTEAEAIALMGASVRGTMSHKEIIRRSQELKEAFVRKHTKEIAAINKTRN